MQRSSDPFVELHNLLALAGASDVDNLDRWLNRHRFEAGSKRQNVLKDMAVALRAYAADDYATAASIFAISVPYVSDLGGSRAQCGLFEQMKQDSLQRAGDDYFLPAYAGAA